MRIYENFTSDNYIDDDIPAVCIGGFDGVHLGHQELLKYTKESSNLFQIVTFEITVSKGTYIRSIVQQLGEYVNTHAIVETLTRTAIGSLNINHKSLNTNVESLNHNSTIMSLDWAEVINLPKIDLDVEMIETIRNGQLLPRNMFSNEENYIISIENNIVAIYKSFNEKYYKPEKVLV